MQLRAALSRALAKSGSHVGVSVYDLTAHEPLFELRDGVGRPPASVEKLYTTVAVLQKLGGDVRLHTTVFGSGHLGPGGVWHGNLYLRGRGDPTFGDGSFNRTWEMGYGPTAIQLVRQLQADGIRRVTGQVVADSSLFDDRRGGPSSGFAPDIPDLGGELSALVYDHGATAGSLTPETFAARELTLTLRGARIHAGAARVSRRVPHGSHKLAVVASPTVQVLLKLMDVPSDDLFAELLTKQLGVRFGGGGTTPAGARVIADAIATYGLHPRILDGSGLDRADQSSPREVVDLLRLIWHTPVGRGLAASLPVVGVNGTVRAIGVGTPAHGHCLAKTGTLNFVTNLAGYCDSRSHHMLAFALFIDGPGNWQALPTISKLVGAIARY